MEKRNFVIFSKTYKKKDGTSFDKLVCMYQKLGETGKAYFDVKFKKECRTLFEAELLKQGLEYPVNVSVSKYTPDELKNGAVKQYFINEEKNNGFTRKYICFLKYDSISQAEKTLVNHDEDDYL